MVRQFYAGFLNENSDCKKSNHLNGFDTQRDVQMLRIEYFYHNGPALLLKNC